VALDKEDGKTNERHCILILKREQQQISPIHINHLILVVEHQLWVRTSNRSGPLTTENMIPAPETLAHKGTFKESKNILTTLSSGSRD